MPGREPSDHDPLDAVLRPPIDETPEEKAFRVAAEDEARRISQAIDESIRQDRLQRKKMRVVRLLLLGQSESGKSTTLRQFQRLYAPSAFRAERTLWHAVIQLNLLRSVHTILSALADVRPHELPSPPPLALAPALAFDFGPQDHELAYRHAHAQYASAKSQRSRRTEAIHSDSDAETDSGSGSASASASHYPSPSGSSLPSLLPPHLAALRTRLAPLQLAEARLIAALVPPSEDAPYFPTQSAPSNGNAGRANGYGQGYGHANGYANGHGRADSYADANMNASGSAAAYSAGEVFVRPGTWKRATRLTSAPSPSGVPINTSGSELSALGAGREIAEEVQALLVSCRADLMVLWRDPVVRTILKRRKIRLEECPGFFLDDVDRIAQPHYQPSDDDVLKARLKTVGVSEYRFEMEAGSESGTQWRIIDVGGSRSQVLWVMCGHVRARFKETWVPFFDDVEAIIFLAPISGFDQTLAEDKSVNRLEDSVLLWKSVCGNKLLARVNLVLFLNKCDILAAKLASGVRLAKYVRSFGERANDSETAEKYFRSKFNAIHREYSPIPRKFYSFCTSVTDTKTTGGIIASVRDMVVREHLRQSKLL